MTQLIYTKGYEKPLYGWGGHVFKNIRLNTFLFFAYGCAISPTNDQQAVQTVIRLNKTAHLFQSHTSTLNNTYRFSLVEKTEQQEQTTEK